MSQKTVVARVRRRMKMRPLAKPLDALLTALIHDHGDEAVSRTARELAETLAEIKFPTPKPGDDRGVCAQCEMEFIKTKPTQECCCLQCSARKRSADRVKVKA
jgi:hypothetical protein